MAQQVGHVVGPALDEVAPEPIPVVRGDGGQAAQLLVGLVVAGQGGEGHAGRRQPDRELLQPVGPVALAAEDPRDDQPRPRGGLVEVEVRRHRMLEVQQRGEAQRQAGSGPLARLGQRRELRVRGGDDDDVGRILAEIDRLRAVGDFARLGQ